MSDVVIGFEDLVFKKYDETTVRALFHTRYFFDIPRERLDMIGTWRITENGNLAFDGASEKRVANKLSRIIEQGFNTLTHLLYNKPTAYISEDSGIPLIGSNEFGVIDRGSNILEIKPLTGCNFNCIYCSVDEGKNKKTHDYLVEEEFLVETTRWVAATKEHPVECNIGPQGEPLLYPKLVELVRDLAAIPQVEIISINTNGSLLSKPLIDTLADAGLTRINLSLNALDQDAADRLSNTRYPLERIKELITYCQEKPGKKINVLLAPTLVPGYNDDAMEDLVKFSRTIKSDFPTIGIQNFLHYPKGRNPVKQRSWDAFYAFIATLEKKTGVSLKNSMQDFHIVNEPELPKPFRKGQIIDATIMLPGRYPKEVVAVAGTRKDARCITIINAGPQHTIGKNVRVKLIRDKHNIYKGEIVKK